MVLALHEVDCIDYTRVFCLLVFAGDMYFQFEVSDIPHAGDYFELASGPERQAFGLRVKQSLRNKHTKRSPCFVHCPGTQERLRSTKKRARLKFFDLLQRALLPVLS